MESQDRAERRELIRLGQQKGLMGEELFNWVDQMSGPVPKTAAVPSGASPVRSIPDAEPQITAVPEEGFVGKAVRFGSDLFGPNTPSDIRQERARQALWTGMTIATSELGGGLMRPLATRAIMSQALKRGVLPWAKRTGASLLVPAARAGAEFFGDVGAQGLEKATGIRDQPIDVRGAAGRAAGQFAFEGTIGQGGRMFARAGGVNPEAAAVAQAEGRLPWMKPKGEAPILRPTSVSEFKGMGQEVAEAARGAGKIAGGPHEAYMKLVESDPNRLIDAGPIYTAVKERVSGAGMGPLRAADTQLLRGLRDLRSKIKPGGMISIKDADDWIRANLTPPALAAQSGSEAAFNEAANVARKKAVPYLYGKIAPEAGALQQATKDMLTKIGAVETMLPEQTPYHPNVGTPQKLRQVLSETEVGQEIRDRLAEFDTTFGTRLKPGAERLAMRESWAPLNREDMGRAFETIHPGGGAALALRAGKAAARGPGKLLTKAARPGGRVLTAYLQALAAQRQAEQPMANP